MGNWLTRILGGSHLRISGNAEDSIYAETVRGAFDAGETEEDYKRRLAVLTEATEDDGINRLLAEKILRPMQVQSRDPKGNLLYVTNDEGEYVLDDYGNRVPLTVTYTEINTFYASLYNLLSKVNRLSFINPSEAKVHFWYFEDMVSDVIMNTPEDLLDSGEIAYMKSLLNNFHILLQDASNGRKLTAFMVSKREDTRNVAVGPVQDKKGVV